MGQKNLDIIGTTLYGSSWHIVDPVFNSSISILRGNFDNTTLMYEYYEDMDPQPVSCSLILEFYKAENPRNAYSVLKLDVVYYIDYSDNPYLA